ncbi:MAG: hypothetical protein BWY70_01560 [Bacteroidetes bacterium ADurb.Bin408]|nr:MAG: hypothetical protein BWY70_01560 [Bacteroidetes bacterium ADurb.Bin408]
MKVIKYIIGIFISIFIALYYVAFLWFTSGFVPRRISPVPIDAKCVIYDYAFTDSGITDLRNQNVNIYRLYFEYFKSLNDKIDGQISIPGKTISSYAILDISPESPEKPQTCHHVLYSQQNSKYYISLFNAPFSNAKIEKHWSIEVPKLKTIVTSTGKQAIICQDESMKNVIIYNIDGVCEYKKTFDGPVILTSIYTEDNKQKVLYSDGERISSLDREINIELPRKSNMEGSFFLPTQDLSNLNIFGYYDGEYLYGFDIKSANTSLYSKKIPGLRPGVYANRYMCPYSYGIITINPRTGSSSPAPRYGIDLLGKTSFMFVSYFVRYEDTYCLFSGSDGTNSSLSIYKINENGMTSLMSSRCYPFGRIYYSFVEYCNFYVFTDRGVFSTDTFNYVYD